MKIHSGKFKSRHITSPKGDRTRPTASRLREALFNICQFYITDTRFLDLCAGSGAMGIEALSRGAISAVFVDSHKESVRCIKKNLEQLGCQDMAEVYCLDLFKALERLIKGGKQFDIIYLDPPYNKGISTRVLEVIDQADLLAPDGKLFIEEGKEISFTNCELKKLKLVDSRSFGNSQLFHFT